MRRAVLLALFFLAGTAHAEWVHDLTPLGWTADGQYFVYSAGYSEPFAGMPEPETEIYDAKAAVVLDAVTGEESLYVYTFSGENIGAETKKRFGKPRRKEFEAWLSAHPVKLIKGKAAPDGKTFASASVTGGQDDGAKLVGRWEDKKFTFAYGDADDMPIGGTGKLVMSVGRGAAKGPVVARWQADGGAGNLSGAILPIWSPDSRRVAWVLHQDRESGEFSAHDELVITGAQAPRVQLKPDKKSSREDVIAALRALDKAGYVVVVGKIAEDHREASVVYAAPGMEAEAQKLVDALPGKGTVAKLDWKPDADVVIALGGKR